MKCEIEFLAVGDASKAGDAIVVRYGETDNYELMVVDGGTADTGEKSAYRAPRPPQRAAMRRTTSLRRWRATLYEILSRNSAPARPLREAYARRQLGKMHHECSQIVLNTEISDSDLRAHIYKVIPEIEFRRAVDECDSLIRPNDDQSYDFLSKRYGYIREFSPKFLKIMQFRSHQKNDPLLKAITILDTLNDEHKRKVSDDAPTESLSRSLGSSISRMSKVKLFAGAAYPPPSDCARCSPRTPPPRSGASSL